MRNVNHGSLGPRGPYRGSSRLQPDARASPLQASKDSPIRCALRVTLPLGAAGGK